MNDKFTNLVMYCNIRSGRPMFCEFETVLKDLLNPLINEKWRLGIDVDCA